MFSIEVHDTPLNWVAAIFVDEATGKEFANKVKSVGHKVVEIKEIPLDKYPVYVLERIRKDKEGREVNCFEYASEETYVQQVRELKQNQGTHNWQVYFTAYILEEDYIQYPLESSLMGALDHTHVDNHFLNSENFDKGLECKKITRLASCWNIDALDKYFEIYMKEGSKAQKEELAVEGYISLFCTMDYDFACGKLTRKGIELLLPVADKASALMGKKLWDMYSRAYMILLQDAIENCHEKVSEYFQKAEKSIQENIQTAPDEQQQGYYHLANIYDKMTEYNHFSMEYWTKAIESVQQSLTIAPEEGNWYCYLSLLYVPYRLRKGRRTAGVSDGEAKRRYDQWKTARKAALGQFKVWCFSLLENNFALLLKIALAYNRLKEQLDWLGADRSLFPEEDYLFWLNEAQKVEGHKTTSMDLIEEAHFLHKEGKRLGRIDLIAAAIRHFERLIEKVDATAFEVYYKASALEDIAQIHLDNDDKEKAVEYMDTATAFYGNHLGLVKSNPSVFMHYVAYLERCYLFEGDVVKPSLKSLNNLATQTEEEGRGMYSAPTMMLIRLKLLEHDEEEVVFHLCKLLLLHELCIEDEIRELKSQLVPVSFTQLQHFLDDTLKFMKEVSEGYYLDPAIKWNELKRLGREKVKEAWEARKRGN